MALPNRFRLIRLFALLLALALVTAACANGDTADEDPADPPAEDDGTEEIDPPEEEEEDPADADADDAEADADAEDDTDGDIGDPGRGGVILFGDEQEPEILNSFLLDGNSLVTTKIAVNVLAGAYKVQPDFSFVPDVLDGEAEVTEDPFSVTYTIREDAAWNDGTTISSDDFVFTYETIMNEAYAEQMTSTSGYDDIASFEIIDEKTVSFTWNEPFPSFRSLFGTILPAHVLEGEDFLTVWNDEITACSAAFCFDEWNRGQQLSLVANDAYWDGGPEIDQLIMRYVPDTTTLTQQFLGAEIDMYDPQPQIELVQTLDGISDAEYEVGSGPVWEHIDFNTLVPGLDLEYVRQAIAYGIDRETIVDTLIRPVNPDAEVLHNLIYVNNQDEYEPHFDQYTFDPDAAIALLEENGCEGSASDGWTCEGTPLEFRIGTTGGNERRELAQQLMQDSLSQVGIQITIENDEGATFFNRLDTPANCEGLCDYDIALFAWVGSPDPIGSANIFGCDRPQNWHAYCNEEATALMDQSNQTVDEAERASLNNQADALLAEGVPVLPLFQQPQFLAWNDRISGPQLNATNQTAFWNSNAWSTN